ncbi:MAG: hypothetical protein JST04_09085 [Bdellovibrionales bacterium]|nr:hypothetical protein [Bdellovibrionales bacterium]
MRIPPLFFASVLAALSVSATAGPPSCKVRDIAHEIQWNGKTLWSTTRVEENTFPAETLEACIAAARDRLELEYERDFTHLRPHGRKQIERLPFRVTRAKYFYSEAGLESKGVVKSVDDDRDENE